MFTMQYPFSFSIGSIPTTTESSSYSTSPIALYSAPAISSYQVLTPNIFLLVFNEQFVVGRKFIVQVLLADLDQSIEQPFPDRSHKHLYLQSQL